MALKMAGTLPDQIADYLLGKIVRLEIEPGERILEKELAEELGVSRSPIREALRILEKTGLVEIVPRHGARAAWLSEENIDSFYDVFTLLFTHVVRR